MERDLESKEADNMSTEDTDQAENADSMATNLIVLDPEHPLMQRVQDTLRKHLENQQDKLKNDLREKQDQLKHVVERRQGLGVELYGVQQQLAQQQMVLEKELDNQVAFKQERLQWDVKLTNTKDEHQLLQQQLTKDRDEEKKLRHQVEGGSAKLHYLMEAHQAVQADIAVTKRAADKTEADFSKAQSDKLQQDIYVEKLINQVSDIEEQLGVYAAQYSAQAQETKTIKEALTEATMEFETLQMEKKKLFQQWNTTLIGMRRRDEVYAAIVAAVNLHSQQVCNMESEIENYKSSVTKEQERNEHITLMVNKVNADVAHVKHLIDQLCNRKDVIKVEYMSYTQTLQETEQSLAKVTSDCKMKMNELEAVRTQIERESLEKRNLENSMMEKMMQQLTMDKATQYTRKSVEKLQKRSEECEINISFVDNEISLALLQISMIASSIKQLQQVLDALNDSVKKHNELISHSELEITRSNARIERKQTQIDQLNKQIDQRLSKMEGGENFGPLEFKISELQKKISESLEQCAQLQQFWLRQQNEVVKMTKAAHEQASSVDSLKKCLLILEQKKLRIDGLLLCEEREQSVIQQSVTSLQRDMIKLNSLITQKKGEHLKLEHGSAIAENLFISSLKEAELESIQLQTKLDQLKEEKERILNSLLEAEQQIMLWERKIQIAKETQQTVESDVGQSEITAMQAEIHRMQNRYDQLMKHQERLIQDMEKVVYRKEAILQRGDAQLKSGRKEHTQGYVKRKLQEVHYQIKKTSNDCSQCDVNLSGSLSSQATLKVKLDEAQQECHSLQDLVTELTSELSDSALLLAKDKSTLASKQMKSKYLASAKEGKYRYHTKSKEARQKEFMKEQEKLDMLMGITEKLTKDFPYRAPLQLLFECLRSQMMEANK